MNLRKVESYNIGLDLGTGSVGWAVTDENGELLRFKSRPTWGSRVFPSAGTAADTRLKRGRRRRYDRRRQRLNLLQGLFKDEIDKADPDFFFRLNQARLHREDRDAEHAEYKWPIFNGSDFTEPMYYEKFPTVYHLRKWLIETEEQADIRLVYLAFHNIVKCRGNFLYQDKPSLSAKNANMKDSVGEFCETFSLWCEENSIEAKPSASKIESAMIGNTPKKDRQKDIEKALGLPHEKAKMAKNIAAALLGYKAEFADVFDIEGTDGCKAALGDDEKVEEVRAFAGDENLVLLETMLAVYQSAVLMSILKGGKGETISSCKVCEYERYGEDLARLKRMVRQYCPEQYEAFFRGKKYEDYDEYDKGKAQGYTRYNLRGKQEDLFADIKKLFKGTLAEQTDEYREMLAAMEEGTFLRRLKTSDNGVIPYQLHLEEMSLIIKNQGRYYAFLKKDADKIKSLVTFRIPYYVGPLTQKNAATANGKNRFAWASRVPGKENEKIYPWNWEEVIDKDESAKAFMDRMVGECTYLMGEQVMPRCSLTYEMYCVLNELAGAKWTRDGDTFSRFSWDLRADMVEELFKKRKTVSHKAIETWMAKKGYLGEVRISGTQNETGFESRLNSYNDFCKILDVGELSSSQYQMAEEIILWNTLFEDRDILKRKIKQSYGEILNDKQVNDICKKRYTGWGRMSKTLLTGIKLETCNGPKTIMDLLLEGDQGDSHKVGAAMTFMEILHDEHLGLQKIIDEFNKAHTASGNGLSVDDLPGSPANRRTVNQAMRIVDEIVGIAGKPPANIFIEVTRDEDPRKKGQRTTRRYDAVYNALQSLKAEESGLIEELKDNKDRLADDRVMLYFMQRGRCMYSGEALDINRLQSYHIDHIIPQSYIKDDSIDNKVLVLQERNERKSDSLLLGESIIKRMGGTWRILLECGLISEKKFKNLTCRSVEGRIKGFVARQLVETSQIVKFIELMLTDKYPDSKVVPVKAALSSGLREKCGFVKCREINDYHHAHDAYLACEMGRFLMLRHGRFIDDPIAMSGMVKKFIRELGEEYKKDYRAVGSAGYFVESFLRSGFDKETGEIYSDGWDAEGEIKTIRDNLNRKFCFISRMPEETSGAFWDATIYSPKDPKKKLSLPLKKGLAPAMYGSYSREQFAYFFAYSAIDKKGRLVAKFAPVPVSVAATVAKDPAALDRYAQGLAVEKAIAYKGIIKHKILKYQLMEVGGSRLYLTGLKEVRNATALAFDLDTTKTIKCLIETGEIEDCDAERLFYLIVQGLETHCGRLAAQLDIRAFEKKFLMASNEDKAGVLAALLSIAAAKTNMINLTAIGGPQYAGCMGLTMDKLIAEGLVCLIDQSVTGMYERRYRLGI